MVALLSYHESFVGKRRKKGLKGCSIVLVLGHLEAEK